MSAGKGSADPGPDGYSNWYPAFRYEVAGYCREVGVDIAPAEKDHPAVREAYANWVSPITAARRWVDAVLAERHG